MKRTLLFCVLLVFITTSFVSLVGCNNQTPTKEQKSIHQITIKEEYELQDKCGRRCEEIFKKEYGKGGITSDESGQMMSGYQNHYNKKLNKCFMNIMTTSYPKDKTRDVLIMKNIWDVNENREYGSFIRLRKSPTPNDCKVLDKICKSEEEWDTLVKPYMEE